MTTWFKSLTKKFGSDGLDLTGFGDEVSKETIKNKIIFSEKFEQKDLKPSQIITKNKLILHKIATSTKIEDPVEVSRFSELSFPSTYPSSKTIPMIEHREDVYDYEPEKNFLLSMQNALQNESGSKEWHVNFADKRLFVAYPGNLFAQDEIQAAEMPTLGQIRETLKHLSTEEPKYAPLAQDEKTNRPTPVLISGLKRTVKVRLEPNMQEERPYGLYGNNFGGASEVAIEKACKILDPPQTVNLICMSALPGHHGKYTEEQIHFLYKTAFTAFSAAKFLSGATFTVVHTGNWGTGAYGGDKTLMAWIQLAAAWEAGVNRLVYHTFNKQGTEEFVLAQGLFQKFVSKIGGGPHEDGMKILLNHGFKWGMGDGN